MHLVDEEHGALALLAQAPLGVGERLADVFDAGGGRRQRDQVLGRGGGQEPGQGRLAGAGRAPQDGGSDPVGLGQRPQRGARADQVLLADHLVERARAQTGGQRGLTFELPVGGVGEEAVAHRPGRCVAIASRSR